MGLLDKLSKARDFVRQRRGPDSYFQYKRKREEERAEAAESRERTSQYAEQERGEAQRERDFDERYEAGRKSDLAGEPDQEAE
jgi:hypothetical protein